MIGKLLKCSLFILFVYSGQIIYPALPKEMTVSPLILLLYLPVFWITPYFKFTLNKWLINIWLWLFPCGLMFIANSYNISDVWLMKLDEPAKIYGIYLLSFTIIVWVVERFFKKGPAVIEERHIKDNNRVSIMLKYFLIFFPFIFFVDFVHSVGYIPILSKGDIVENIYELDYGHLYAYIVYLSVSLLYIFYLYQQNKHKKISWLFIPAILAILFFSIMEGKRLTILTALFSLYIFYAFYIEKGKVNLNKSLLLVLSLGATFYTVLQSSREGQLNKEFVNNYIKKFPVGGEFRDFAFTANYFTPGSIPNYNYHLNCLGAFVNRGVLNFFHVNKDHWISMGSEYTFMEFYHYMFGVVYAIRTGLFSELYFAYAFYGILVLFLFAIIIVKVSSTIENGNRNFFTIIINCVIYSLCILLVVGQSDAFWGQVVLLIYLLLIEKLLKLVFLRA